MGETWIVNVRAQATSAMDINNRVVVHGAWLDPNLSNNVDDTGISVQDPAGTGRPASCHGGETGKFSLCRRGDGL